MLARRHLERLLSSQRCSCSFSRTRFVMRPRPYQADASTSPPALRRRERRGGHPAGDRGRFWWHGTARGRTAAAYAASILDAVSQHARVGSRVHPTVPRRLAGGRPTPTRPRISALSPPPPSRLPLFQSPRARFAMSRTRRALCARTAPHPGGRWARRWGWERHAQLRTRPRACSWPDAEEGPARRDAARVSRFSKSPPTRSRTRAPGRGERGRGGLRGLTTAAAAGTGWVRTHPSSLGSHRIRQEYKACQFCVRGTSGRTASWGALRGLFTATGARGLEMEGEGASDLRLTGRAIVCMACQVASSIRATSRRCSDVPYVRMAAM
ncbi:hypothetical protein BD413DRAFT_137007 [Trametes elegans]|nr:hypothetical protein BD413DRAFT_137007 [Trametes elegans]